MSKSYRKQAKGLGKKRLRNRMLKKMSGQRELLENDIRHSANLQRKKKVDWFNLTK